MCGVFGFIANNGKRPDFDTLARVARVTETRGKHAWGMAWIDSRGVMHSYRQAGKISDSLSLLRLAADARLLIGHCRYATQGEPENNLNNHPHPADGGWIVHNGMIPNYHRLLHEHTLFPSSECDSEVIGLLVEKLRGTMVERLAKSVDIVQQGRPLVVLGLWKPNRLVVARGGNPLYFGDSRSGTYLASLPEGLPGDPEELPDNTVTEFSCDKIRK
jgi:glucosamine 6-phosphate synthetase-like amidotransferase/phosphosugar isomerase protein